MNKGIRPGVIAKFAELLPTRQANGGPHTDTQFRKNVIGWAIEQYTCTLQAASTHYNHAKKKAAVEMPELVIGLGRAPEKNNGGRKKKVDAPAATTEAAATETVATTEAAATETVATTEAAATDTPAGETVQEAAPAEPAATPDPTEVVSVYKQKNDEPVVLGITRAEAEKLVEKARAAKKGALYIKAA